MSMNRTKNKNEPCPFCGNSEIGVGYNDKEIGPSKWRAVCYNCGAHGPYCNTSTEAMEEWNHRFVTDTNVGSKERTAKVEVLEMKNTHNKVWKCSNCGQYMHRTNWSREVKYCSHCGCRLDWDEDISMEYFESEGR